MYSMKLNSDMRYVVTCIVNNKDASPALVDAIFDTGAKYTCYKAETIDSHIVESRLRNNKTKFIGGFVDGSNNKNAAKFYKFDVMQYVIGGIDLGRQQIWVTFDNRVSDNVIGMDMLQKLNFLQHTQEGLTLFKNWEELSRYVLGGDISRKVQNDKNGSYIVLSNMKCYLNRNIVKCDTYGSYVEVVNGVKCYLT